MSPKTSVSDHTEVHATACRGPALALPFAGGQEHYSFHEEFFLLN